MSTPTDPAIEFKEIIGLTLAEAKTTTSRKGVPKVYAVRIGSSVMGEPKDHDERRIQVEVNEIGKVVKILKRG